MQNFKIESKSFFRVILFMLWFSILSLLSSCQCFIGKNSDIKEFARQTYIEGLPYDDAILYDTSVVEELLKMLDDPADNAYWPNVIALTGIIGNETTVKPLIDFLHKDAQFPLTHSHFKAKIGTLMTLGYLVYKTEDEKALDYLIDSTNTNVWNIRKIKWISPYHSNQRDLYLLLTKMAIIGLGLSGNESAAEVLRSLQSSTRSPQIEMVQDQLKEVVADALHDHAIIVRRGLGGYYRKKECIEFDNHKAVIQEFRGRWKIKVDNKILADFGSKEANAQKGLRVLTNYHVNEQCFIGLPKPSMEYYLSNSKPLTGSFNGEDCIAIEPKKIKAKEINGEWQVKLADNFILYFSHNRYRANLAVSVIQKNEFTRACIIGMLPNPSMTYFVAK